ncbi:MAG TPA: hypothetical protein VMQ46_01340 [Acidimicrobiia bacterium]|nr:hypothetical protein [Acidimicrobiia bacterium]
MRIPTFSLLAVLALLAAACGGGTTDTTSPDSTTSTLAEPAPEAVVLSYGLEPGTSFSYEVDMDQAIDLMTSGDPTAMGEDEIPAQMSLQISGTSTLTHTISEGPEPGTFEVNITGDFSNLEFSGTIDGEPVEEAEIPDIAELDPIDVTVIVDEQGNVIPEDEALGEDFLGGLGGLGGLDMLGQIGAAGGAGQFVGPPLSDEEVTVGDTWSETIETPTLPDDDPITTLIESEVVGTDSVDGAEVFIIETTTTTSPIEFDLAELLLGLMSAFMPEEASEEERAEIDAIADEIRFAFSVDETVSEMTTWFDHDAGVSRQAEFSNSTHMVMDMNVPDEATGELVGLEMDMGISQDISYRLTDSSGP